ncbi:FAD-dependent oxidoreductase [Candidatus Saccharibacteria bacterium]|nr:FAD-dependent oxidoreductase [Candidatus Saccharibacteria bacterium]
MYDIAIIGGGPAGLTAAIYARRAGKKCIVLEAMACGGQILNTNKITNYPALASVSGPELAQNMEKQVTDLGAEIEFDKITGINPVDGGFEVNGEDGKYSARSVIIATGTTPRKLGLEHEDELIGRGISYCATCDGAFYKDKTIAVYGGGYSAVYSALYLADIASKVYLIHHRDELRATGAVVDALRNNPKVQMLLGEEVEKLLGDDRLTGVEFSDGRKVDVDGLFVSIGREPKCDFCSDLATDGEGYIVADEGCITSIPGVFVAGDVRTKELRQIVTATADGAAAAEAAIKYLH